MYDVIIIGGGASGLFSALRLVDNNLKVCIVESNDRVGKKLLATGNGKCNILNNNISIDKYNNNFLAHAINKYSHEYIESLFKDIGIILKSDEEGREYPYSESANTVLNLIRAKIEGKIKIYTNNKVERIEYKKESFIVNTPNLTLTSKYLIFATGSKAGFGYNCHDLIANFGHKCTKLNQALVPIKVEPIKGASGVRSKVEASLYINNELIFVERGEILFKDRALSGILAFKMSTYIARYLVKNPNIDCKIYLDFAPTLKKEFLYNFAANHSLEGLVHKAIYLLVKDDVEKIKRFEVKYQGLMGFDQAQVISGGIDLMDISEISCESKLQNGLFVCGEVLDIDGECGGFNLTSAMLTALLASDTILERCK